MGSCRDCIYFVAQQGYHIVFDGYCLVLRRGDSHKGVNRSNGCNHFSQKATASNSGFSGCFLTSACTEFLGKSDDCEELTKLRAFRDNYMKSSEYGKTLVDEYYRIAPEIVEKINASGNKKNYYDDIYQTILLCITEIDSGNNEKTLNLYKQMVDKYKKLFLI